MIARLLHPARVRAWCACLLAAEFAASVVLVLGTHGAILRLGRPTTTDFVSFYAAGRVAHAPGPFAVYDRAVHAHAEQQATEPGIPYVFFFYPPTFVLVCDAIARLPYLLAFLMFETLPALLLLALCDRIVAVRPASLWLLPALSYAPLLWSLGVGQNSALSSTLFAAGGALLMAGRPFGAGLSFAGLLFKPHFGLLLAPALLAGREWRALAGLVTGSALFVAASVGAYGVDSWTLFAATVRHAAGEFAASSVVPFDRMASVAGGLRLIGVPRAWASWLATTVALTVGVLVARHWHRTREARAPAATAARMAVLIGGTLLVMPVVLFYDLAVLLPAACFLWRSRAEASRYDPVATWLAAIWLAGFLVYPFPQRTHLPVPLLCDMAFFAVALGDGEGRRSLRHVNG